MSQPSGYRKSIRSREPAAIRMALLIVYALCQATAAHAEPLQLELVVERTERARDCADGHELRSKIQRLSQRTETRIPTRGSAASSDPDLLRGSAHFDKSGDDYVAELRFSGAKAGERRLTDRGRDCTSLEDAVAVAIVLLLDSENQQRERAPSNVDRVVPTINISRRRFEVQPVRARAWNWLLSVGAGPLWGASQGTTTWFALDAGWQFAGRWQLELGAFWLLPNTTRYGQGEVVVSMVAAEARACRLWGRSFLVGGCAVPTLGRLHGTGRGFDESISSNLVWAALGASVLAQLSLGQPWILAIEGTAWRPLSDHTFSVENVGSVWNASPIWGALALRLGVRLR